MNGRLFSVKSGVIYYNGHQLVDVSQTSLSEIDKDQVLQIIDTISTYRRDIKPVS